MDISMEEVWWGKHGTGVGEGELTSLSFLTEALDYPGELLKLR